MNKRTILALLAASGLMVCLSFAQEVVQLDGATLGNTQTGWRWCSKCDGLHFILNGLGPCPAGGTHSTSGSGTYVLINNNPIAGYSDDWRYCYRCKGLCNLSSGSGACPAGGTHDATGSGHYSLISEFQAPLGQSSWEWCARCRGLYYAGSIPHGVCPAGGQHGAPFGPGDYVLSTESKLPTLFGHVYTSTYARVANAQVQATKGGTTLKTKTAADGSYCFTGITLGKNTIKASKRKVGDATGTVRIKSGDAKYIRLVLEK
ncbi:MAG: carboxypeptidase-like regulatory domain-containing protein [Acidobacteriota bacterium]